MYWDLTLMLTSPTYDPATVPPPCGSRGYNIFCSGFYFYRTAVVRAGGHSQIIVGLAYAYLQPIHRFLVSQPDMNAAAGTRQAPSWRMERAGDIGDDRHNRGHESLPQVWQTATVTWRNLTNAQLQLP